MEVNHTAGEGHTSKNLFPFCFQFVLLEALESSTAPVPGTRPPNFLLAEMWHSLSLMENRAYPSPSDFPAPSSVIELGKEMALGK